MIRPFISVSCLIALPVLFVLPGCHSAAGGQANDADTPLAKRRDLPMFKRNPEFRAHPKKEAVAEYKVRTGNRLNELYFSVRLYETPVTMQYLAKVDFEGLPGEDTIKLPDLGTLPAPLLKKGPEKYSCIVGFMDNDKTFRELKKIYVTDKGDELKITALHHYIVTEGYRLVTQ